MCKLVLDRGNLVNFTSVSNVFIDEYMPKANGEFIKIYLHLLRLVNSSDSDLSGELSTERIADKFNMLEADVLRALNYWCDQELLSLSFNDKNELTGIKLESAFRSRYIVNGITNADASNKTETLAPAAGEFSPSPVPNNTGIVIPAKKKYSAKEISAYSEDERLQHLTFLAQAYLGKPLSSTDINSILYMLESLRFGTEFIEYIMETCISSGHKTLSYIEKQAVEYARKGISTIEDAKYDEKLRLDIFKSIYKIFGLASKSPIKKEVDYVIKWTDQYGFSDELILEACSRTMEHTHMASFQYADRILTNWFKQNAKSMDEIIKLDNAHSEEMNNLFKAKKVNVKNARPKNSRAFKEREYNYGDLEKQLRNNQNDKIKKLLSAQDSEE